MTDMKSSGGRHESYDAVPTFKIGKGKALVVVEQCGLALRELEMIVKDHNIYFSGGKDTVAFVITSITDSFMTACIERDTMYFENANRRNPVLPECAGEFEKLLRHSDQPYPYSLDDTSGTKELKTEHFQLRMPIHWEFVPQRGIDSYGAEIRIAEYNTTLKIGGGKLVDTLNEGFRINFRAEELLENRHIESYIEKDGKVIQWVLCCPVDTIAVSEYDAASTYQHYDLEGVNVTAVVPVTSGIGLTGISMYDASGFGGCMCNNKQWYEKFYIYGEDLSPDLQQRVLEVLSTLKMKQQGWKE